MQQRLVAWGDIGTDRKALFAIEFKADENLVVFKAWPDEQMDKDIQHRLFTVWKNGGEFEFPGDIPVWEVDAATDNLLPEGLHLHKPNLLVQAQGQWNRIKELETNFKLLGEKLHLIELEVEGLKEFDKSLWNKAKALWSHILDHKKNGTIGWTQADELKVRIDSVFEGLKAFRRLNKERNFDESSALFKVISTQIKECEEKLVYPDEWKRIFNRLKEIQADMKGAPLINKHYRKLRKRIDGVYNDLRKYRESNQIKHLEDRISGLNRVLFAVNKSIKRDEESHKTQFERMKHYTRGKMSDEEIESQLKYLKKQVKDKEKKLRDVEKTIRKLEHKLEKLKNPPKDKPKKKSKDAKKKGRSKDQKPSGETKERAEKKADKPGGKSKEDSESKPKERAKGKSKEDSKGKSKDKTVDKPEVESKEKAGEKPADAGTDKAKPAEKKDVGKSKSAAGDKKAKPAEAAAPKADKTGADGPVKQKKSSKDETEKPAESAGAEPGPDKTGSTDSSPAEKEAEPIAETAEEKPAPDSKGEIKAGQPKPDVQDDTEVTQSDDQVGTASDERPSEEIPPAEKKTLKDAATDLDKKKVAEQPKAAAESDGAEQAEAQTDSAEASPQKSGSGGEDTASDKTS